MTDDRKGRVRLADDLPARVVGLVAHSLDIGLASGRGPEAPRAAASLR